MRFR
jgi:hypothetical protein